MTTTIRKAVLLLVAMALAASACTTSDGSGGGPGGGDLQSIPKGCTAIDMAVSPEKVDLLTDLARTFNASDEAKAGGRCAFVRVQKKSSGVGMSLLVDGWPDEATNGPRPVIWSPASAAWGAILNYRLSTAGQPAMAPTDAKPFMLTPLVIAMPKPMAEAIGWPATPIGFADILKLAQDPAGWGGKGHPEWGPFRLAKTNPNFSTSGLSATIAQYYAATGKTRDLTAEDLARPEVDAFARGVENAVVHYGDITPTFLNNWYRNDARGTALTYTSALAVEEKSVIDYNLGNPDGITDPGEKPRPPKIPLVAIYPKEGTLFSDSPFYVVDAPWVDAGERAGAQAFAQFVQEPANQRKVLQFGFRPANPQVGIGSPIDRSNGLDPDQPQNILQVPDPPVLARILELWGQQRRSARVMLVIDVSGSMGDPADDKNDQGETKLELAKQAAVAALSQFKDDDDVALRIFSTDISPTEPTDYLDLVPFGPIGAQREQIASKIRSLVPTQGTPLYTVAEASFENLRESYDAAKINAVVLLTDGRNEDPRNRDVEKLLTDLRSGSEGQSSRPVRIFPIAYGKDADLAVLKRIAEATNAAAYDASNPATIIQVFTAVISNF
ncbi:MAG: Ca-activated chloride channel [Actinomycetota bacterium]|jgi:Ca-activated chloride channel family protein|nr:Ca-activated chloride channel [Actinomycetota bacterium]